MCQIKFPRRKWDVMIIHHSHTDIGYTETQSTIERWQVDFVRQALDYIEEINSAEKNDNEVGPGIDQNLAQQVSEDFNEGIYKDKGSGLFKWNIESFWVVEKFLETATRDKIDFFINCIKNGYLGISASYLNNNELLDFDNMNSVLKRSTSFCNEIGHPIDTAMTADINGYGWGFARALIDNKIYNLYTCTHSHHAMYPGNRRQYPFWWETPQGERILVWNGEHYMFGNEMGLVPGGIHRGFIHDGFDTGSMRPLEIMENRLPVYLRQLEMEDYPYNFVPLTVSGLVVDNAPPNKYIPALIQKWNSLYGQHISLRMVTIEQVFKKIRDNLIELPVYRGDWPDWWSDGLSSIANHTKIFRQAQRDFKLYKLLAEKYNLLNQQVEKQVENNLALYAEHTYAYHHSIANPFDFKGLIHLENKKSYSVTVYNDIKQALNKIYSDNEQQALSFNRSLKYKVINPYPCTIEDLVRLPVKTCEFAAGELKPGEFRIIDSNKKCLSFQQDGEDILVKLILCPHEDKTLEIVPEQRKTDALIRSSFDIRGNSYINPYQERATDIIRENSREDSRENSGENTSAESSIL
ncbi:MAG: hypothetical protein ACLFUI_09585, partial [Halanaerobiales bacterium]